MSLDAFFDIEAGGHRLRARRIGAWKGEAPVLVFLHEGLGSISQWRDFPEVLARACGLPALIYDRQGHGGSEPVRLPRPPDFLDREAERVLPEVLAACGIARPILVGHSDGGTIALLFAAAYPDRPLACIVEAAHVVLEDVTLRGVRGVQARWLSDPAFRDRLARHHGANAETMVRGWAETWTGDAKRGWSMVDRLPAIRCPALAIQGEADEHGTNAQVEAIVSGVSGHAESHLIPGCGHVPHHEARGVVLGRMRRFVRTVLARSGLSTPEEATIRQPDHVGTNDPRP